MNERQEQTADVLGKLTVLGTIVLPMNIVTGMWGMNVLVPGQDVENLHWFWCSKSNSHMDLGIIGKGLLIISCSYGWATHLRHLMFLHREKGLRYCMSVALESCRGKQRGTRLGE